MPTKEGGPLWDVDPDEVVEFRTSIGAALLRLAFALAGWALVGWAFRALLDARWSTVLLGSGLMACLSVVRFVLWWRRHPRSVLVESDALTIWPNRGEPQRVSWSDLDKASQLSQDDDAWRFRLPDGDVVLKKYGFSFTDWRATKDHVREACFRHGVPYSYVD